MSVLVNFRIDEDLKSKMDEVCKDLGITMSAAFNMFAKNLVKNKSLSFSLDKKLDSGIDLQTLLSNLSNNKKDLSVIKSSKSDIKENKYFINKIGNIIMLVPKDDVWAGLRDSVGNMSDDYMLSREQVQDGKREEL